MTRWSQAERCRGQPLDPKSRQRDRDRGSDHDHGSRAGSGADKTQHSGKTGFWQLNESVAVPAVTCTYNEDTERLASIDIATPTLYARNASLLQASGPGQTVGWKVIVQRKKPGHAWKTVESLGMTYSEAWYDTSAYFDPRSLVFALPINPPTTVFRYRIIDRLVWLRPTNAVAGAVKARYDFYAISFGASTWESNHSCPSLLAM